MWTIGEIQLLTSLRLLRHDMASRLCLTQVSPTSTFRLQVVFSSSSMVLRRDRQSLRQPTCQPSSTCCRKALAMSLMLQRR